MSLDQAFAHCPIFLTAGLKLGPCLSSDVADRPLRPTKGHRLGEPLPHQLPDPKQAHFKAAFSLSFYLIFLVYINVILIISNSKADSCFVLTRSPCLLSIRLACVKRIASVHSGPGSNPICFTILRV